MFHHILFFKLFLFCSRYPPQIIQIPVQYVPPGSQGPIPINQPQFTPSNGQHMMWLNKWQTKLCNIKNNYYYELNRLLDNGKGFLYKRIIILIWSPSARQISICFWLEKEKIRKAAHSFSFILFKCFRLETTFYNLLKVFLFSIWKYFDIMWSDEI